jgi:CRP-like cAMP-binding protein
MPDVPGIAVRPDAKDALLRAGRPRAFRPGEVVFHQGDPCDSLFLLRRGRVAVRVGTPDGDQVTVGLLAAPEEFGELALLRPDHHHSATVIALDDVQVLAVPASRFAVLRRRHPELDDWLLHALARRLDRTSALLADALFVDADHRVARRLLDSAQAFGVTSGGTLPLAQDDLAAMAGVSRPTANRALRRLETSGVITLGRRRLEINDLDALIHAAG